MTHSLKQTFDAFFSASENYKKALEATALPPEEKALVEREHAKLLAKQREDQLIQNEQQYRELMDEFELPDPNED